MRRIAFVLAIVAVFAACSSDSDESRSASGDAPATTEALSSSEKPSGTERAVLVSSACNSAFAAAANVDELMDTVSDLYPAVRACQTLDEWVGGAVLNPGAIDVDPEVFIGNVCSFPDDEPDIVDTPLCREVLGG